VTARRPTHYHRWFPAPELCGRHLACNCGALGWRNDRGKIVTGARPTEVVASDHVCSWEPAADLGVARYRCARCGRAGHRATDGTVVLFATEYAPPPADVVRVGAGKRKPSLDDYDRPPS
jgi:hypothetical protein